MPRYDSSLAPGSAGVCGHGFMWHPGRAKAAAQRRVVRAAETFRLHTP